MIIQCTSDYNIKKCLSLAGLPCKTSNEVKFSEEWNFKHSDLQDTDKNKL